MNDKEVGIYLEIQELTVELAKESIDTLLTDPKYAKNAKAMQEIYKSYDPVDKLDEIIRREVKKFDDLST